MTARIFTFHCLPAAALVIAGCLCSVSIHAAETSSEASSSSKVHPVAETKKAAKEIGKGVKKTTKVIGHATRDATKAIGHAARDVTREIGHATRDGVKELKKKD